MWIQPSEVADLTTKTRGLNPENRRFNQQNKRKIRPQDASTNNMPEQKKQRQPMGIHPLGLASLDPRFQASCRGKLGAGGCSIVRFDFPGVPNQGFQIKHEPILG